MEANLNQPEPSFFEKLNTWIRNSVTFKIFSIGILILLMLIPTSMVESTIREREYRQEDVVNEISQKWSNEQIVSGPIISVPYKFYFKDEDSEKIKTLKKYAHFLPEQLKINGDLTSELKKRGIYEAVLYETDLNLSGSFNPVLFDNWKINSDDILWDEAFIALGISDMRGINNQLSININDIEVKFNPGIPNKDVLSSGVSVPLNLTDSTYNVKRNFNIDLSLKGSKTLEFLPLGEETDVSLTSNWEHPKFDGNFLPDDWKYKEGEKKGFDANWKILQLNRNFPQQWLGSEFRPQNDAFGLDLKVGVNQYQKNMRSAKYAVLIISLTFILFFFVEVINRKRIHPIQYLLVGFALSIFYTLLLAISEHSSFGLAYIVSSIAVISLIVIYMQGMLKNKKITSGLGAVLSLIYAFVFVILQLQDYALLMGSIGLFTVLAIIMYYTRKIDWYNLKK